MKNASKVFLRLALLFLLAAPFMVFGQVQKTMTPNPQLFVVQDSLSHNIFFGQVVNSGYEAPENSRTFTVGLLCGQDTLATARLGVPKSNGPSLVLSECFSFVLPTDRSGLMVRVDLFDEVDEEDEDDNDFSFDLLSVDFKDARPTAFRLEQNYPNPFNPSTTISFKLEQRERITLRVFDLLGHEVAKLADGIFEVGNHQFVFDAANLASKMYFYQLVTPRFTETKRMTLIR